MNGWLAVLLIVVAVLLACLIVRQADRQVARRQAAVARYFAQQVAELARLDELENAELEADDTGRDWP